MDALRGPQFAPSTSHRDRPVLARELGLPSRCPVGDASGGRSDPSSSSSPRLPRPDITFVHCNTLARDELSSSPTLSTPAGPRSIAPEHCDADGSRLALPPDAESVGIRSEPVDRPLRVPTAAYAHYAGQLATQRRSTSGPAQATVPTVSADPPRDVLSFATMDGARCAAAAQDLWLAHSLPATGRHPPAARGHLAMASR